MKKILFLVWIVFLGACSKLNEEPDFSIQSVENCMPDGSSAIELRNGNSFNVGEEISLRISVECALLGIPLDVSLYRCDNLVKRVIANETGFRLRGTVDLPIDDLSASSDYNYRLLFNELVLDQTENFIINNSFETYTFNFDGDDCSPIQIADGSSISTSRYITPGKSLRIKDAVIEKELSVIGQGAVINLSGYGYEVGGDDDKARGKVKLFVNTNAGKEYLHEESITGFNQWDYFNVDINVPLTITYGELFLELEEDGGDENVYYDNIKVVLQ